MQNSIMSRFLASVIFRMVFSIITISLLLISPTSIFAQPADDFIGKTVDHNGLWIRIDPAYKAQYPEFTHALSKEFVDGAAIMIQWAVLEPKPGVYNFEALDKWIEVTTAQHKKIGLGLMAGMHTPEWLYAGPYNVPRNAFDYNRNPQGAAICTVLVLPSPWNENFIKEFNLATAELARHLREFQAPGIPRGAAYDALRIVKLTGINNTTEELRLNANKGDNGPCHQSDAQQIWASAGFTPTKIARAWHEMIGNTGRVFHDKILSMDIIQSGAFPSIDESGRIYTPPPHTSDVLTARLIEASLARFRGRLSIQWNALSQREPNPAVIDAGRKGAIVAWQMNEFLGPQGGSGCFYGEQRSHCKTNEDFEIMLRNGIDRGAHFIEIWATNVDEYDAVFRKAHDRLKHVSP